MHAVAVKNTQEVTGLVKSESLALGGAGRVQSSVSVVLCFGKTGI